MKAFPYFLILISLHVCYAQTPEGRPIVYTAEQNFLKGSNSIGTFDVFADQNLSPRILKPTGNTEKIRVMYVGHWLDITDEVTVSGGGGVSFDRIVAKGNNDQWKSYMTSGGLVAFHGFNWGVYCIVDFTINNSAAVGTHTVKLRRPRIGLGKDEAEFYLEVRDYVRVYEIDFRPSNQADFIHNPTENQRGRVRIQGQNLDQITNVGNADGFFSNVSNVSIGDKSIGFDATLARSGTLYLRHFMGSVTPRGLLVDREYPISFPTNLSLDIRRDNSENSPNSPSASEPRPDLIPENNTSQFIFGGANGTSSDGTLTYEAMPEAFCLSLPNTFTISGQLTNGFSPATTDRRILRLNFQLPDINFTVRNRGSASTGTGFQVTILQGTSSTVLVQNNLNTLTTNATATVRLSNRGVAEVYRLPGLDGNDAKACYVRRDANNQLPQVYVRENQGFTLKVDTNGNAPNFTIVESNENNNSQLIRAGTAVVANR